MAVCITGCSHYQSCVYYYIPVYHDKSLVTNISISSSTTGNPKTTTTNHTIKMCTTLDNCHPNLWYNNIGELLSPNFIKHTDSSYFVFTNPIFSHIYSKCPSVFPTRVNEVDFYVASCH